VIPAVRRCYRQNTLVVHFGHLLNQHLADKPINRNVHPGMLFAEEIDSDTLTFDDEETKPPRKLNMSVRVIIAELPKLREQERELILRRLVNLDWL
jgi:hypothetical protein